MLLSLFLFLSAALLTYAIREFALKKELLDHPNERSSHTVPTPHGGGIAIVLTCYAGFIYLFTQAQMPEGLFWALMSSLPLFIISLIDDVKPLSAKLRIAVHLFSAGAALYFLGGVQEADCILFTLHGLWLNIPALLLIVWMLNLYNFLDGIDGYAGSQAVFIGLAAFMLFGSAPALAVAMAALGFLLFNWQKASIFMGDVGSAFLGFIFAVLALHDASSASFLAWITLPILFGFDATLTLYRRFRRGENVTQAHKEHAYQRLVQSGFSHQKTVVFAMFINLMLLSALLAGGETSYPYILLASLLLLYTVVRWIDRRKRAV